MSYLALARKYRPQNFDELIGQEFVSTSLKNAISLGRVSHAYLFTGARGVGKTSAARIMAKALNCLVPINNNPCNKCEHCIEITAGASIDIVEIDGASNRGIDEIRQLRDAVKFIPVKYKYKVYIIDEIHMLTEAASNALLKTLEEPPSYVVFIFATTDVHKIIPTILSRCQRYDFKKITFDDMHLTLEHIFRKENVAYEMNALNLIIRHSDGCMRDALSFSDQIISYTSGNVNFTSVAQMLGVKDDPVIGDLFAAILREDAPILEELIQKLCDAGVSFSYATEKMLIHTRNLLLLNKGAFHLQKELTQEECDYYDTLKKDAGEPRLFALFQLFQKLYADLKYPSFARYIFEFGLYKAASLSRIIPLPVSETQTKSTVSAPAVITKPRIQPQPTQPHGLSLMEKRWSDILHDLKKETPSLAVLLDHSILTECSAEKVVVQFLNEQKTLYNMVVDQKYQSALKNFLQRKLNSDIELEIRIGGERDLKKKSLNDTKKELESLNEKKIRDETAEMPVMKHLLKLFEAGAEDLKINKK
ncbi:MAG: DNA polymerase III subunit gamma/tau [Deferribacteraceae bacterium]|jgi:DNA polymerase-3 subunit gamma/tau|nr:DNA polymerase III subunit gamma/tau [Deferribacteraceae bacterium]